MKTVVVGLIGAGIQASKSPALHMREGAELGLGYEYRLLDVDQLPAGTTLAALINEAEGAGFAGLNITHPFKQSVIPLLTKLSSEAEAIGAVNTVVFGQGGERAGHNTDSSGFRESFQAGLSQLSPALDSAVQLGAGGAGAATAHALLSLGVKRLTIFDPDRAKLDALVTGLARRFGEGRAEAGGDLAEAMRNANGLLHATPTGMAKYPGLPLPAELLLPSLWVCDVVYVPLDTELLRTARAHGCRTLDGGGMAVFQAVGALRLFTGLEPNPCRMLRHFAELTTTI